MMQPYYQQDGQTIYCADCRDVLNDLPDGSVDLVFTSPPYNLGLINSSFGHYAENARLGKRGGAGKWDCGALARGYDDYDDAMPLSLYEDWQRQTLRECWRLLADDGAIFYNHKPRVQGGELWTPLTLNPGLPLRQIIVWARAGGVNFSPSFYCPTHEWIMVLAKERWRLTSKGASGVGDVWSVAQEANSEHPAPFPEALPLRAIETTNSARVLDPFAGIGTTLLAAKRLGRSAIGIELNERYCEIAANRLAQGALTEMFA